MADLGSESDRMQVGYTVELPLNSLLHREKAENEAGTHSRTHACTHGAPQNITPWTRAPILCAHFLIIQTRNMKTTPVLSLGHQASRQTRHRMYI